MGSIAEYFAAKAARASPTAVGVKGPSILKDFGVGAKRVKKVYAPGQKRQKSKTLRALKHWEVAGNLK
jgi:hypothetical protein